MVNCIVVFSVLLAIARKSEFRYMDSMGKEGGLIIKVFIEGSLSIYYYLYQLIYLLI